MGFWIGFKRAFFARAQFIAQAKPAGEHDAEVGQRRPTRLRWTATGHVSVAESPLELPLQMNEIEILHTGPGHGCKKPPTLPPFQTWALSGRLRIFCRKHARRKQARQGMRALSVFSYLFLLMRVTVVIKACSLGIGSLFPHLRRAPTAATRIELFRQDIMGRGMGMGRAHGMSMLPRASNSDPQYSHP